MQGSGMDKPGTVPVNWSVNGDTQTGETFKKGEMLFKEDDIKGFSSSLPVLFHEKLNFTEASDDALGALDEDMVSMAIGNLLPDDEDELLAGIEGFDLLNANNNMEETEFDLFSSGGGLEMDGETQESFGMFMRDSRGADGFLGTGAAYHGSSNGPGSVIGEHPYGEHPSRTLFVRNINSNVEDSELRTLFEHYGDIRTLYTACKHRGFVMISYYDIRAARSAMRALQNKPLRRRKLDIHFSIPKDNPSDKDINQGTLVVFNLDASVSNDDLRQIFGQYGEVKEIRETPHKRHHKFIEFYDVRAAEAALKALNRSDIAGKRIKLEPSRPGGTRRNLMQQLTYELEQEEARSYWQQSSPPVTNSPPGHTSGWGQFGSPVENGPRSLHQSLGMIKASPGLPIPPHSGSLRVGTIGSRRGQNDATLTSIGGFGPKGVQPQQHPHSLPEVGNRVMPFYNPPAPAPIRGPVSSHGSQDGIDGPRFPRTTTGFRNDSSLFEHGPAGNAAVGTLGRTGSGSGGNSLTGAQFLWGNSSPYQQSSPMVWSNPPMGHSLNHMIHPQSQPSAYMGNNIHLVNTVMPSQRHYVGSDPSGDPTFLERQFGYLHESPDTPFFGPGSPGTVRVPRSTGVSMMSMNGAHGAITSGSFGTNVGFESGAALSLGMMPSHRRSHMFLAPGSDMLTDRGRIRRTESNGAQADNKKQYQLDIDKILRGEDSRTTLMIKNIPNKYSAKMLCAAIDENHRGKYDFFYLPIDFKNKCNVGYAFINMTSPEHIISIYELFNGKRWEKFNSEKVASLAYARIQGKAALVAHFQNSSLMNEDKRCRPILFHSENGELEQAPLGVSIQVRLNRDEQDLDSNSTKDGSVSGSGGSSSGGTPPEKEQILVANN